MNTEPEPDHPSAEPAPNEAAQPAAQAAAQSVEQPPAQLPVQTSEQTPAQAPPTQRLPDLPPAECAALLAARFPAVFGKDVHRPLKLRIAADIQQEMPNTFTKRALSAFLHRHTTSTQYLKALANEPNRYDLNGAAAGEVSAEHRQAAADEVQRRRTMQQQRRTGAIESQRKAEAAQRDAEIARREADGKERAARARVLRAFETSNLTRANFCTLMGVADAELDGLLAQARDERQRHAVAAAPAAPRSPNARPR
jgi:ProP effector